MLGCLILAGKSEESRVERMNELFALNPDCSPQRMLNAELLVIQALNFNMKVFHPFNLLQTFLSDIKRKYSTRSQFRAKELTAVEPYVFDKWLPSAENVLTALQFTNACLLYSPLDIAFSGLYLTESNAFNANKVVINKDVIQITMKIEQGIADAAAMKKSVFLQYFSEQFGTNQYSLSMSCVEGITSLLEAGQNCQDGREISQAHAAMKRLKSRAQWAGATAAKKKGRRVKAETTAGADADVATESMDILTNKRIKFEKVE